MDGVSGPVYNSPVRIISTALLKEHTNSPLEINQLKNLLKKESNTAQTSRTVLKEKNVLCKLKKGTTVKLCTSCAKKNKDVVPIENEGSKNRGTTKKAADESSKKSTTKTRSKKALAEVSSAAASTAKDSSATVTKSSKAKKNQEAQIQSETAENKTVMERPAPIKGKKKRANTEEKAKLTYDASTQEESTVKSKVVKIPKETTKKNKSIEDPEKSDHISNPVEKQVKDTDAVNNIIESTNHRIKTKGTSSKNKKDNPNEIIIKQEFNSIEEKFPINYNTTLIQGIGCHSTPMEDNLKTSEETEECQKQNNKPMRPKTKKTIKKNNKLKPVNNDENIESTKSTVINEISNKSPKLKQTKSTKSSSKKDKSIPRDQTLNKNHEIVVNKHISTDTRNSTNENKIINKIVKKTNRRVKNDAKVAEALRQMSLHFANIHIGSIEQLNIGATEMDLYASTSSSSSECPSSCSCRYESESSCCDCWECVQKDLLDRASD